MSTRCSINARSLHCRHGALSFYDNNQLVLKNEREREKNPSSTVAEGKAIICQWLIVTSWDPLLKALNNLIGWKKKMLLSYYNSPVCLASLKPSM